MNVDVADYDNDGWLDIYVTNITDEYMKECTCCGTTMEMVPSRMFPRNRVPVETGWGGPQNLPT